MYTPEYIINNHTIFPIYAPFLSVKARNEALDLMKYGNNSQLLLLKLGCVATNIKNNNIKMCPHCINEDRQNYGEAYIHRTHQVPGY